MKITPITKENLSFFQGFITEEDKKFIREDMVILPLGLVADDLEEGRNVAAGALCLRPSEYELKISSFYVAPDYRGRGAGKFLLDEARRIFGDTNMEFDIEFLINTKDEENLQSFLENYGFMSADPENEVVEVCVGDLKSSHLYGKSGEGTALKDISPVLLNVSQEEARKSGAILPLDGLRSENIDIDVSVGVVKDDRIESFVIFEKLSPHVLLLSSLYVKGNEPATVLHILEKSVRLMVEKYPPSTRILIQPVEETSEKMIDMLFEEPESISCRYRYIM